MKQKLIVILGTIGLLLTIVGFSITYYFSYILPEKDQKLVAIRKARLSKTPALIVSQTPTIMHHKNVIEITKADNGKTIHVHVGDVVVITISPIIGVYLSNNTVLQPTTGYITRLPLNDNLGSHAAHYIVDGFTSGVKPVFSVVSPGIVYIDIPDICSIMHIVPCVGTPYKFQIIADQ